MASPSPPGNMKWVFSVKALERCTGRKTNRRASCTSSEFLVISTSVCGNHQKREKTPKKWRARRKEPHLGAPRKQRLMLWGKVQDVPVPVWSLRSGAQVVLHRRNHSCTGGTCPMNSPAVTPRTPCIKLWGLLWLSAEERIPCQEVNVLDSPPHKNMIFLISVCHFIV